MVHESCISINNGLLLYLIGCFWRISDWINVCFWRLFDWLLYFLETFLLARIFYVTIPIGQVSHSYGYIAIQGENS